jgi:hypothetical protein
MAGISSSLWFRVLALCIALGAGGGYVWIRQQKAAEVPSPAPVEAEKPLSGIFPATPVEGQVPDLEEILMSSSKSGIIFDDSKGRTVLPSSKLGVLPTFENASDPAAEDQKRKRLLPGSKSIGSVLEGDDFISREDVDRALEKRGTEQEPQEP